MLSSAEFVYADANALFDRYMHMKAAYHAKCARLYAEYARLKEEFDAQPAPKDETARAERARAEKKLVGAAFVLTTMNLDTRVGVTD